MAIDLASGAVTSVIEGLDLGGSVVPGAFSHGHLNGVAVSPDGSIVVTADGSNSVIRFRALTE